MYRFIEGTYMYLPYISDYFGISHAEIPSDSLKQSFVESHGGLFYGKPWSFGYALKFTVTNHKKWTV
jgi:hypothetical protein